MLTLFIAYQPYRYSFTHEIGLIALSIFDLIVIALAVNEYRLFASTLPEAPSKGRAANAAPYPRRRNPRQA